MLSCATPTTEHFVVDVHDVISTLGNDRKESQATVSAMHATPFGDGGLDATPDGRETPGRWRAPVVSFVHAKRRSATRADGEDTSMPSVCVCRPPYADQALPTDRHAMRSETQLAAIRDAFVDASATATRFLLRVGDVLILDSNRVFHGMDPDNDKDARLHRLWVWTSHRPGDVPACLDQAMDDEALWMVPHQMPRRADDIDDEEEEEEDPIPGLAELRGTYVGEGGMNAGTTSVSESEAAAVYAAAGIAPGARVGAAASLLLEAPAAPRETQLDPFGRVIPELRGTRCVSLLFGGVATMTGFADGRLLADTNDTTLIDLASSLCEFDLARWTRESTVQVPLSSAVIAEAPAPATDFASRRDARRRARGGGGGDVAEGIITTTTTTTTTTTSALIDPPVAEVAQTLAHLLALRRFRAHQPELADGVVAAFGCGCGELAALCAAGSVSEEQALRLAHARGQALQAAANEAGGTVTQALITGLTDTEVAELVTSANAESAAESAAALQLDGNERGGGVARSVAAVISERWDALRRGVVGGPDVVARIVANATKAVEGAGAVRARTAAYATLAHTPRLQGTAALARYKAALAKVPFIAPKCDVFFASAQQGPSTAVDVAARLLRSVGQTMDVEAGLGTLAASMRDREQRLPWQRFSADGTPLPPPPPAALVEPTAKGSLMDALQRVDEVAWRSWRE